MNAVFLDTVGLIAVANRDDQWHAAAVQSWQHLIAAQRPLFTSNLVLIEIADGLSRIRQRPLAIDLRRRLLGSPRIEVVAMSDEQETRAWDLYEQRSDKDWGMTDCVSMIMMEERGCREVFSVDRHFQQAGLQLLIESSG